MRIKYCVPLIILLVCGLSLSTGAHAAGDKFDAAEVAMDLESNNADTRIAALRSIENHSGLEFNVDESPLASVLVDFSRRRHKHWRYEEMMKHGLSPRQIAERIVSGWPPKAKAPSVAILQRHTVIPLRECLTHTNERIRSQAARILGRIREKRAFEDLLAIVSSDSSADVRAAAAEALGYIRDHRAITPLTACIAENTNANVSLRAAEALAEIGSAAVVQPIASLLTTRELSPQQQRRVIVALGVTGEAEAVKHIAPFTKSRNANVRVAAAQALGYAHASEAVPFLIELLRDKEHNVRIAAAHAAALLGDPRTVKSLASLLDDAEVDCQWAGWYGLLGAPDGSGTGHLLKYLGALDKRLFFKERHMARRFLQRVTGKQVAKEAAPFLTHKDTFIRQCAARLMSKNPDSSLLNALVARTGEEDDGVRSSIAAALGCMKDQRAIPALVSMMKDKNSSVRGMVGWSFGYIGGPTVLPYMKELLKDTDAEVRGYVVIGLRWMQGEEVIDILCRVLRGDEKDDVKASAVGALLNVDPPGTPDILAALQALRGSKNERLRLLVVRAIKRFSRGNPDARPTPIPARPIQKEIDTVTSRVKDTALPGVEWLIYENKFVARKEKNDLRNFTDFLSVRGIEEMKVNSLAFTTNAVWAATSHGALCYERKTAAWIEYAVNREHIGMPIHSIKATADGRLLFTIKTGGTTATYEFDPTNATWKTGNR